MNFRVFAESFKICVDAFIRLSQHVKRELPSSLTTVGMLLFLYAGSAVVAENGNVVAGLQRAFIYSDASKEELFRIKQTNRMQTNLFNTMFINQQIESRLRNLLDKIPSAARTRVAVIHNGTFTLSGTSLLKFDITHAEAKSGRSEGDFTSGIPLSQWNDYLSILIRNECAFVTVADLREQSAIERMRKLGIKAFLACPIMNAANQMLGGLFVSWDDGDAIPEDKTQAIQHTRDVAAQIGVALEVRPLSN